MGLKEMALYDTVPTPKENVDDSYDGLYQLKKYEHDLYVSEPADIEKITKMSGEYWNVRPSIRLSRDIEDAYTDCGKVFVLAPHVEVGYFIDNRIRTVRTTRVYPMMESEVDC